MSKQCNTGALRMPLLLTIKEEKVGVKCHCSQDCRHIENKKKRAMKTQSILCLTAVLFATLTNGQLHSSSKRSDEGANKKWLAKKKKTTPVFWSFSAGTCSESESNHVLYRKRQQQRSKLTLIQQDCVGDLTLFYCIFCSPLGNDSNQRCATREQLGQSKRGSYSKLRLKFAPKMIISGISSESLAGIFE